MKEIYKALAAFQQEVPIIHKGAKGYGYSYADLPAIFEVINPILKTHGLGFTQLVGLETIKTVVFHVESGEIIETETSIPQNVTLKGMNDFQVLGSAITYIRRYALSSALGLVTDKDTDANEDKTKQPENKAPEPKKTATANDLKSALALMKLVKTEEDRTNVWKQYPALQKNQEFINVTKEMAGKIQADGSK